ncbi:hypothetical protein Btru_068319 [Bulinus truncatus]|nr:hypothetical protein Btru_068319 [Bulinus truncatus]
MRVDQGFRAEILPPLLYDVQGINETNVKEGGNFSITVRGNSSSGQSANCKNVSGSFYTLRTVNQSCVLEGTANSRRQEVIAISTVASTGIESRVVTVCLTICSCQNEGVCDYSNTRKIEGTCNRLASCNCTLGYVGQWI